MTAANQTFRVVTEARLLGRYPTVTDLARAALEESRPVVEYDE